MLILASRSPQRSALLAQVGVPFTVVESAFVEDERGSEPRERARANALGKARDVASRAAPGAVVLGADTVVALDGRSVGSPESQREAREMLAALSGRVHEVATAVVVIGADGEASGTAVTGVRMRDLVPALLDWYLETGEWRGRAGGYAIQGSGCALVAGIEGDYTNVVGLPVPLTLDLLAGAGLAPWELAPGG